MFPYLELFNRQIPMYGACTAVGIAVGLLLAYFECKRKKLIYENILIIGACGALLGFLGSKLFYIFITYSVNEVITMIREGEYQDLITGGFVFYGGLLLGIPGILLGMKIADADMNTYGKVIAKAFPVVHAFGRIGCLFAGCCYGAPYDGIFSVTYTNPLSDAPTGVPLLPVQAIEALGLLLISLILYLVDKKRPDNVIVCPVYLLLYAIERFLLEYLRFDGIRGFIGVLSTSQTISILLFITSVVWLIATLKKEKINL